MTNFSSKCILLLFASICLSNIIHGQEEFKILRVSLDHSHPDYPEDRSPIVVEWSPVTEPSVVRLEIHQTWSGNKINLSDPLKVITDPSQTIDTIFYEQQPDVVTEANQERPVSITVVRMINDNDLLHEESIGSRIFNRAHNTIFIDSNPDKCDVIEISWNSYSNWENEFKEYIVYGGTDITILAPLDTITKLRTQDFIDTNPNEDVQSNYLIKAVHVSDTLEVYSNVFATTADFQTLPEYTYITHVNNKNNYDSVYFNVDPQSELDSFILKRAVQPDGDYINYKLYTYPIGNDAVRVNRVNDSLYYYKLFAYNECSNVRGTSNINHPIILKNTDRDKNTFQLEWTNYIGFDELNGLSHYRIIGYPEGGNIVGNTYALTTEDTLTIQVQAIENTPDDRPGNICTSNEIILKPVPEVYFREAYRIGGEATIGPTIENTAIDYYEIKVFNRNGIMVYENTIEETMSEFPDHHKWDGKYNNSFLPAGTYIYHMLYSVPGNSLKAIDKGYFILAK
ncbi:MAG: hypothetical protein GVY19_11120 [Bacteroidetes bacterium]|jgi:hypothetical protein|nr:hypothetical protein [Bacteroidota bacterium]